MWFTGVSNGEEACRKGSFTTLRAVVDTMRIMAVACDKDKKKNRGPVNMWYSTTQLGEWKLLALRVVSTHTRNLDQGEAVG